MTPAQKFALRISEIRQRLNSITALEGDAYDEPAQNEERALISELNTVETRYQTALRTEGDAQAAAAGAFGNGDGEQGERGRLLRETRMADYLGAAAAGIGLMGRPAELNSALGVALVGAGGGVAIPWEVLLTTEARQVQGQSEQRAFTTTAANDGPEMQRPILQRLFGPGVLDSLGVRLDSVPTGRAEWPIITSGVAPAQTKEGTAAADAVVIGFGYANLKPKRLTGQYEYSHEMAASVPELEAGIRRDLADAIKSKMSDLICNGVAPTNSNPQNIEGLLTKLTGADLSSAAATAADYGSLHALAVDGIHASMETEVMSVIGDETYQHAAGVYIAGSGESGSELLRRRSMGCMASTYLPDAASMKQAAILHAAGPNGGGIMRGDSVAAVWPTLEIVRDIYSQASQGVRLTWISLWDAHTALRSTAYKQIDIQIA